MTTAATRRDRTEMWNRTWRFFLWVLPFSLLPYVLAGTVGDTNAALLVRMTGSGQMVITSFALWGTAMRDISSWSHAPRLREVLWGIAFFVGLGVGIFYKTILGDLKAAKVAGANPSLDQIQHTVAWQSLLLYLAAAVTSFIVVVVGTPKSETGEQS